MKLQSGLGLSQFLIGSAALVLTSQPAWAAATQVTAVRMNAGSQGFEITLETQAGDRAQLFAINRGNAWVADLINTQLQIGASLPFVQSKPAPGIASVTLEQIDPNSVRITVVGETGPLDGKVAQQNNEALVLSLTPGGGQPRTAQAPGVTSPALGGEVRPEITVNGIPIPARNLGLPPTLPRAVAPPVGDIAIATLNTAPATLDLGTNEQVPRLVLRDAPAREVLTLLARAANMNMVYTGTEEGEGPLVTLDIENESVQDVFNYVLRITNLKANRVGRTIFAGNQLPEVAQNLVARTLRLNQVNSDNAAAFLATQGAAVQQIFTPVREIRSPETGAIIERIEEPAQLTALTVQQPQGAETAPLLLRDLSVTTDERLNLITLIGQPRTVETAIALVTQLDARRRQVAVNVKVIDVNLLATDNFSTSFSFAVGDTFFSVDGGRATVTSGSVAPPTAEQVRTSPFNPPVYANPLDGSPLTPFNDFVNGNNGAPTGLIPGDGSTAGIEDLTFTGTNPRVGNSQLVSPDENAPVFLDIAGVPRRFNELTLGGGNVVPFDSDSSTPEIDLLRSTANVFLDTAGVPRRLQELTVQGGPFAPLLQSAVDEVEFILPEAVRTPNEFLFRLQAEVQSNTAKILSDPTVVVQEGQSAQVKLTREVITNIEIQTEGVGAESITRETAEKGEVGLTLDISVSRIDDNGFVVLAVEPKVSSIAGTEPFADETLTLIAERSVTTGQVRMRDGQTLILSGIIQEEDRTLVTKVPLLGDLPLIGSLFRSTKRDNIRAEVIVLVTPQVLDDSVGAGFGYKYTPSPNVQEILKQRQPR